MDYDVSDILGGGTLPVGRNHPPSLWSTIPDFAKTSLYIVCGLVSLLFLRDVYHRFLRWRELGYRKATRRRHGILDSDQRPFNVAYAAALNARQEREAQSKSGLRMRTVEQQTFGTSQQHLRHDARNYVDTIPGGLSQYPIRGSSSNPGRNSLSAASGHDRYNVPFISAFPPSGHGTNHIVNDTADLADSPVQNSHTHSPRKNNKNNRIGTRPSKRTLEGDDESETDRDTNKKSRVAEEELVNQENNHIQSIEHENPSPLKRGSKRLASPGDDDSGKDVQTNRGDKRARKVSRDNLPEQAMDEPMEDADMLSDSVQNPRGKKRDRGDAGSTFGGDEDSFLGDEDEKHRRRRRQRTVSNKKHPRGQKRGRDLQTVESDSEEDIGQSTTRRSRKKRGKKTAGYGDDDISMEELPLSVDPLCKGRAIGEEWERNGTRYKVGPNGDRLRQTLVKRNRPKYPMPVDSEHPDKDVMIEVIVETWLTEEEYRTAKERFELAWQDPPHATTSLEPDTPCNVNTPPPKGGKNLLWSSTTSRPESPVVDRRRPFRQSIATNVGLHLNPFQQSQSTGKGRITSAAYSPSAGIPDTPKLRHAKSYSKWEKQDLEAEAMAKIKQRLQEQKKAAEEHNKPGVSQTFAPPPGPSTSSAVPNFFTQTSSDKTTDKACAPSNAAAAAVPVPPVAKEPLKPFTFTPVLKNASSSSGSTPSMSSGKPLNLSVTPATTTPSAPAPASSMPNFFGNKSTNNPPAVVATTQPSTSSSQSPSGFPPINPASTPSKPSFTFSAPSAPKNLPAFGATTLEQPKISEPAQTSTGGPSLLSRAGPSTTPTPITATSFSTPTTGGALFSFPTSGAAPSNGNKNQFTFGVTSESSSTGPTTSTSGSTQQQQPTSSSPFSFQQNSASQHSTPKFSFGATNSTSQPKADTGAVNAPHPFGGLGGTSNAFPSTISSSASPFGQGSDKNAAAPEASRPPTFNFGISSAPAPGSTSAASSKPSSTPFGGGAPSTTPGPSSVSSGAFGSSNNSVGIGMPTSLSSNIGSSVFGSGAPTTTPQGPFSFNSSNSTLNATTNAMGSTSKPSFTFGTPNTSNISTVQSNPTVPVGGANPFTFGTPTSGAPTGAAATPSAFGFGNSSSAFGFEKTEEKK